jgi:hypothetical protein
MNDHLNVIQQHLNEKYDKKNLNTDIKEKKEKEILEKKAKKIAIYYDNYLAYIISQQTTYLKDISTTGNIIKYIEETYENVKKMDKFEEFSNIPQEKVPSVPSVPSVPPSPSVGGRHNSSNHTNMIMVDIKSLCKANQIKLSTIINNKRVVYTKKELITKLKRKKII